MAVGEAGSPADTPAPAVLGASSAGETVGGLISSSLLGAQAVKVRISAAIHRMAAVLFKVIIIHSICSFIEVLAFSADFNNYIMPINSQLLSYKMDIFQKYWLNALKKPCIMGKTGLG
jgi:hypothetical protein